MKPGDELEKLNNRLDAKADRFLDAMSEGVLYRLRAARWTGVVLAVLAVAFVFVLVF